MTASPASAQTGPSPARGGGSVRRLSHARASRQQWKNESLPAIPDRSGSNGERGGVNRVKQQGFDSANGLSLPSRGR